jgi:transcriptional regulator with XRE-family HTH domain
VLTRRKPRTAKERPVAARENGTRQDVALVISAAETEFNLQRLGQTLHDARRSHGWSLQSVAAQSGLSIGLLSQIERGQGNPSFVTLLKLQSVLGLPWEALYQGGRDTQPLVRAHERRRIHMDGTWIEMLTPNLSGPHTFVSVRYPPGYDATASPIQQPGHQSIHILRGKLDVFVGQETFHLATGDTLTFSASVPHAMRNSSRGSCDALIVRSQSS